MEYLRFVELREPICAEFEDGLDRTRRRGVSYGELERFAFLYRQLLHDHALARTRYPGTAIARRLERLVLAGTHRLQRDTGEHLPTLDAVLLDLIMPELSGLALLEKLREHFSTLPIVVATGLGGSDSTLEAMRRGASDFMTKRPKRRYWPSGRASASPGSSSVCAACR